MYSVAHCVSAADDTQSISYEFNGTDEVMNIEPGGRRKFTLGRFREFHCH